MDLVGIKSQEQVLDVFENLFNKYSTLTKLPKFKKRRLVQTSNSKICHDSSKLLEHLSLPSQSSIQSSEQQIEEGILHHHGKEQGSFSSGVFSIDSDVDIVSIDDDSQFGAHVDGLESCEKNSLLYETPSEAGSGIVECSRKERLFTEYQKDVNGDQDCNGVFPEVYGKLPEDYGKLTDEDVSFMMYKPKLKKRRRKKPPWQKRKLDFDDLWVKGQHLHCSHVSKQEDKVTCKLYLERNLRWGKIIFQDYMAALRKSRKGRKRLNSSCKSSSKKHSVIYTSSEGRSCGTAKSNATLEIKVGQNESLVDIPCKRTTTGKGKGKNQSTKVEKNARKGVKQSNELRNGAQGSLSEASEQDMCMRSKSEIPSRTLQGRKNSSRTSKEVIHKRAVKKTNAKMEDSNSDKSDFKGMQKKRNAKNSTVSGNRSDRSSSRSNCSTNKGSSSNDMDSEVTRTQKGHPHRLKQMCKTSGKKAKQGSRQKDTNARIPLGSNGWHHSEVDHENSESPHSLINFITLTPKKSRKLSRRKRHAQANVNPLSASDSSDSTVRSVPLHPRGSSLIFSHSSGWEDDDEVECRPLFGSGSHCGGVWNTIIEESS